jgi:hypothetical protein
MLQQAWRTCDLIEFFFLQEPEVAFKDPKFAACPGCRTAVTTLVRLKYRAELVRSPNAWES